MASYAGLQCVQPTAPWESQKGITDASLAAPDGQPPRGALPLARPSKGANSGNKHLFPPARPGGKAPCGGFSQGVYDSYLVDSASSHMLVSKIKPCKSKFKHINSETANGSLNQLSYI